MPAVLGVNAVFHDPAAALVVDGHIVAAAEEERFSRRKHGKDAVPFSTWELPAQAARWCLEQAGMAAGELDAVGYSYQPSLGFTADDLTAHEWEPLRTLFAERTPRFLSSALPGLDPARVAFVPHHVAHAASAYLAAPQPDPAVLVLDGRGEQTSGLTGATDGGRLHVLRRFALPNSMGLFYEELTEHLGFRRSSDEYKVMALASYGEPRHLEALRADVHYDGAGGYRTRPVDWTRFSPRRSRGEDLDERDADLAASAQRLLEEVELAMARWVADATGARALVLAGGVALNCVANSAIVRDGAFDDVWVQPAAGDAGTALGAALFLAHRAGDRIEPMRTAALGRAFADEEIAALLTAAQVPFETPSRTVDEVADVLAADGIVGWVRGRSEWGPRALGHRSLLANPRRHENLERLNHIKGREQFRPVAPMVPLELAPEIFEGPLPSPHMLFTHTVRPEWRDRIPAVVHVDGSARVQTVARDDEPEVHALLHAFAHRTGVPVLVNTSLNTGGRPMVDSPRDALECFGSTPIDLLVLGSHLLRRAVARPAAELVA